MAFDAGMVRAISIELERELGDAKIEKINQPEKDEIVLLMHTRNGQKRLTLSASANNPRVYISSVAKENPSVPPLFCTLLRKQIGGARLAYIKQIGFERAIELALDSHDELGYPERRYIIVEIMGRYSNIILTDGNKKIINAIKQVDISTSTKRQVLPGMLYELPPAQDKRDPLAETAEGFSERAELFPEMSADKFITAEYMGISSLVAREIAVRAGASRVCDAPLALRGAFFEMTDIIKKGDFAPFLITEGDRPIEYAFTEIRQYGESAAAVKRESFSALIEEYFARRDNQDRTRQRAADLYRLVSNVRARLLKKISAQEAELLECEKKEEYRRLGDLITSNMYMLKKGMTRVEVTDYYSEDLSTVTIELDPRYTPAQTAQMYYKKYTKYKTAEGILAEQMRIAKEEIAYLDSVEDALSRAVGAAEIDEIRAELSSSGYGARIKKTSSKTQKVKPREYYTSSGCRLLCGRNNLQNDSITTSAAKSDWWFHVKGAPGSHVVMECRGEEPPAEDFTEAAALAAFYSSQSDAPIVSVDYTQIKYIKKPSGSKPGFVTYTTYWSAHVKPAEPKN